MFSGKTTEAVRRVRKHRAARANVLVFKHAKDTRRVGRAALLSSHDETTLDAVPVPDVAAIRERIKAEPKHVDCVCIDEVQFLTMPKERTGTVVKGTTTEPVEVVTQVRPPTSAEIAYAPHTERANVQSLVTLVLELRAAGTTVILTGLDTDKHRRLWPWTAVIAHADMIDKLTAICADCRGDGAIYSRCTTENTSVDDPGGAESYCALCPACWDARDAREAPPRVPAEPTTQHWLRHGWDPNSYEEIGRRWGIARALNDRVMATSWGARVAKDEEERLRFCLDALRKYDWDIDLAFLGLEDDNM
jgi:thymidine kinase